MDLEVCQEKPEQFFKNIKSKTICKSDLLGRGWTLKTIKTLLPEPIQKQNPRYKCAAPMLLWDEELVIQLENTSEFQVAKAKKDKRSKSAIKVCEKQTQKLIDEISKCRVSVKKIIPEQLEKRTIREKSQWYFECGSYNGVGYVDEQTLKRWEVNYIRHNLTEYDDICNSLFGRIGKAKGYALLREKVLDQIAFTYPYLAEECERQKMRI